MPQVKLLAYANQSKDVMHRFNAKVWKKYMDIIDVR